MNDTMKNIITLRENEEDARWLIKLCLVLLGLFILSKTVLAPTVINGSSMDPTLHPNEFALVYFLAEPKRGDVVVADSSTMDKLLVKRLIALPGDTVSIANGHTYLNGELLEEPYVVHGSEYDFHAEVIIPEGYCFLMGDNRVVSNDSRGYLGLVPLDEIQGTVIFFPF